jgi:hypothetical protein
LRKRDDRGMRRVSAAAGFLALVLFVAGMVAGDLVQRDGFSPARDDISDLGATTASHAWLYDRVAANAGGLLLVVLAVGLWRFGRVGSAALAIAGVGTFLDGLFLLDCQGIDVGCANDSWHAHAHKIESGVTAAATLLALVLLAVAVRRRSRLPLLALPALFAANLLFSSLGAGAATRAGTVVVFAAFAYLGSLLRTGDEFARVAASKVATPSRRRSERCA